MEGNDENPPNRPVAGGGICDGLLPVRRVRPEKAGTAGRGHRSGRPAAARGGHGCAPPYGKTGNASGTALLVGGRKQRPLAHALRGDVQPRLRGKPPRKRAAEGVGNTDTGNGVGPRGKGEDPRPELPPRPPPAPKSYPPLPTSRTASPRLSPDLPREGERFSVERSPRVTPPGSDLPPAPGPTTRPASGVVPPGSDVALSRIAGGDCLSALGGAVSTEGVTRSRTRFPYVAALFVSLDRSMRGSDRLCCLVDGGDSRCHLSGRAGRSCAGRSVTRFPYISALFISLDRSMRGSDRLCGLG